MNAEHAKCAVAAEKYPADHVEYIKGAQPFLIKAALLLFRRRHKIMVGDDARHAETRRAFHPQILPVPVHCPGLLIIGNAQIIGVLKQPDIVIRPVPFQHGARGVQRLRNIGGDPRPKHIIHNRLIEAPDQAGNPCIDNSLRQYSIRRVSRLPK